MATSYTSLLGLALPVQGELSGTWGNEVNNYITSYVDAAVAGTQLISGSQTAVALSVTNGVSLSQAAAGATGSAQYQIIRCSGNPASLLTITAPAASKVYLVINDTSTAQSVKLVGAGPTAGVTMVTGERAVCAWSGSDFVKVASSVADGVTTLSFGSTGLTPSTATSGAVTVAGTLAVGSGGTGISAGTSGGIPYYSATNTIASSAALAAGALVVGGGAGTTPATTTTGTGVVTALGTNVGTAGAFVVNGGALGTPSSGTLTSATGLPLTTGVTGTLPIANGGTGTTSTTFADLTTNVTGILPIANGGTATATPALVQGTGVTITGTWPNQTINATGTGGTVTSVDVSGGTTGLTTSGGPISTSGTITLAGTLAVANGGTGITSLGAGVATFLGTPSSANLASAVTDETGTGALVFATSPTLVTPLLGTPTSGNLANCTFPTLNQNTTGSAATFTSTSQNSQFNSVGVGTAASGTAGEIRATNNVTAYYSDDRLKKRLGGIENALDKVRTLDSFYYEANETAQELGYEPVREVGISAQQVQAILPEVVAPAPIDDRYLTVRYERLVPLLIAAIKELEAKVKVLEAK